MATPWQAKERRNLLKAAEAAERAQGVQVDQKNAAGDLSTHEEGRAHGDRGSDEALPSDISALQNITYDELIEMEQSLLARLQTAP